MRGNFENYLGENEDLLWVEQPKQGYICFIHNNILVNAFFILLGIIFVVLILGINLSYISLFVSTILGAIFILLFFYWLLFDTIRRKNMYYALTDKHLFIESGIFNKSVSAYDISSIGNIKYSENRDKSGSIRIYTIQESPINKQENCLNIKANSKLLFEMINDAEEVYKLILFKRITQS